MAFRLNEQLTSILIVHSIKQDMRKAYPEVPYVAVGFLDARLHVLCFTPIAGGIRVISFRKANQREVRDYEQTYPTH